MTAATGDYGFADRAVHRLAFATLLTLFLTPSLLMVQANALRRWPRAKRLPAPCCWQSTSTGTASICRKATTP